MIKDTHQKDILCRHFTAQNYYVQPEVPVFHTGGIHGRKKLITDVDVFALRPGSDLRWELALADCKTLKGQSPANRVLWLRGLMEHFSASSGIIILQRKQAIESNHKLFAASLRVNLIDEDEFERYDRAIVYPEGSSRYPISIASINELRLLHDKYERLRDFCEYIYSLVWNEETRFEMLRKVIGQAQAVSQEVDPDKTEHLALVLDAAGIFAIGLAECVGTIFNQYLQPDTLNKLDDALKVVIWGGRDRYDFIATLRHDLLLAKGRKPGPEGALSLPAWDDFLHLVRSMLENPRLSFSVPQLLRRAAIDTYQGNSFLASTSKDDLFLVKYGMLTVNYFCKAAKFPVQTRESLEKRFIRKQSDLVHHSTSDEQLPFVNKMVPSEDNKEQETSD